MSRISRNSENICVVCGELADSGGFSHFGEGVACRPPAFGNDGLSGYQVCKVTSDTEAEVNAVSLETDLRVLLHGNIVVCHTDVNVVFKCSKVGCASRLNSRTYGDRLCKSESAGCTLVGFKGSGGSRNGTVIAEHGVCLGLNR